MGRNSARVCQQTLLASTPPQRSSQHHTMRLLHRRLYGSRKLQCHRSNHPSSSHSSSSHSRRSAGSRMGRLDRVRSCSQRGMRSSLLIHSFTLHTVRTAQVAKLEQRACSWETLWQMSVCQNTAGRSHRVDRRVVSQGTSSVGLQRARIRLQNNRLSRCMPRHTSRSHRSTARGACRRCNMRCICPSALAQPRCPGLRPCRALSLAWPRCQPRYASAAT